MFMKVGEKMSIDTKSVVDHFGERMKRLAIYEPLYRLGRKVKKDNKGQEIPYYELGMLTLLFFFENMIMRQKTSGSKELTLFLYEVASDKIALSMEGFEDLAREILEVFRPPSGKRNSMTFHNWETGQEETAYYSILKAARSDLTSNTQYYTLDEGGLELIFSSREYFSEFQISISQLLLRKQLEKGEFIGALRQVDEMTLAVEALRDRLAKLKSEVARSIVSEETYERYKHLIEDINNRLSRENDEFDELQEFVRQTKNSLKYQLDNEKDKKAYDLILKIDKGLEQVHNEHGKLLQESIELRTNALEAAQQALYFIGIDSFNFQQDITNAFLGTPLPVAAGKDLIAPFSKVQRDKLWYPLSVFSKQRIEKNGEEGRGKAFAQSASEEELDKGKKQIRDYFMQIMKDTLAVMDGRTTITLEELLTKLQEISPAYLEERVFYDLWIILHQKSPIDLVEMEEDSLLSGIKQVLGGVTNQIKVMEVTGEDDFEVSRVERFKIKNMCIDLGMHQIEEGEESDI